MKDREEAERVARDVAAQIYYRSRGWGVPQFVADWIESGVDYGNNVMCKDAASLIAQASLAYGKAQ